MSSSAKEFSRRLCSLVSASVFECVTVCVSVCVYLGVCGFARVYMHAIGRGQVTKAIASLLMFAAAPCRRIALQRRRRRIPLQPRYLQRADELVRKFTRCQCDADSGVVVLPRCRFREPSIANLQEAEILRVRWQARVTHAINEGLLAWSKVLSKVLP